MLFTETVEPRTLSILGRLMKLEIMQDAALAVLHYPLNLDIEYLLI